MTDKKPKLGIALGSGAARGIAHLGVLRYLTEQNISPNIVAGTSIGAFIGACYAADKLDDIEEWFRKLTLKKLISVLDPKLSSRGGLADGEAFVDYMSETFGELLFEELPKKLTVVATDMVTGREVWFESGPVWPAVRASMAYPGLIAPVPHNGSYLLDGGLVNPVPVIACTAAGAKQVIAVNLNADVLKAGDALKKLSASDSGAIVEQSLFGKISGRVMETFSPLINRNQKNKNPFGIIDVLSASINVMQDRITRSRLAGEPPDVMLMPRLASIGMFEVERFEEIFDEGYRVAANYPWEQLTQD